MCNQFVSLSTPVNAKLLHQFKSGFKRAIKQNKHQSKVTILMSNSYLVYLIDPSFQGVNRLFVLLYEYTTRRTVHIKYYRPTAQIKGCNVMID